MQALRELLITDALDVRLDAAALDLARIEHPDLDSMPWLEELDRIALAVADRTPDLSNGFKFVTSLNAYLFEELGFHGNETFYYDPRNSCLNDVLAFRTGIPITLAVVYMEVSRRLAKPVYGIGAPGHFIVEYDDGDFTAYIDPFRKGRMLSREQCIAMVTEYLGSALAESALARATPKQILVRMLRNLEGAYVRQSRFDKALIVGELLQLAGIPPSGSLPRARTSEN